jgi:SET domain-containing protein
MLLVKTRLGESAIHGIGLFADEFIPQGTVTWRFMAGLDLLLDDATVNGSPEPIRSTLQRYCYLDAASRNYVFCLDNARFMNHADAPNTVSRPSDTDPFGVDIAVRDIAPGEELTCDYGEFDGDMALKRRPDLPASNRTTD